MKSDPCSISIEALSGKRADAALCRVRSERWNSRIRLLRARFRAGVVARTGRARFRAGVFMRIQGNRFL